MTRNYVVVYEDEGVKVAKETPDENEARRLAKIHNGVVFHPREPAIVKKESVKRAARTLDKMI